MIHVHARNPAGASFHKKCSHFTHGCSAVRRGGWRRSVVNANHSLMGILQTARKCLCNFILILIQLPIEVAFGVPREPKRSQHFCHKFIFKLALGGLTAQGRASSSQGEAWCPEPVRWGASSLPPTPAMLSFWLVQIQRASSGSCDGFCRLQRWLYSEERGCWLLLYHHGVFCRNWIDFHWC